MSKFETNEELMAILQSRGRKKSFAAGAPVLYQGEDAQDIGLVISGKAKAVSYSEGGEETWLGRFCEGEFFGHISFLTQMPIGFEVTAETDMQALMIPAAAVNDMLGKDTDLGREFSKDLALRLSTMINRLIEALTLSAKGRVCAELMRLANPIGVDPDKLLVRPNPVFVELALRINSTRETVSRTVSELQKKGVLSREPGAILIHKPQALKASIK